MSGWCWAVLTGALLAQAPDTVELTAERVVHEGQRKLTYAEGHAELRVQNGRLTADRITWDQNEQIATAVGNVAVRLTENGLYGVVADVVTLRLDGNEVKEVYQHGGTVLRKKGVTPEQLLEAGDPAVLKRTGQTVTTMTANHLVATPDGWKIEQLELVPCECNFDDPSWSIRSSSALIDSDSERATLTFPTIRIYGVPVLWLPWLSLPLSDRQSGLLVPRPTFTALNGLGIEVPVFVTLGRSADLTLTPGYYGGSYAPPGVMGPRLHTEFRYAPSRDTLGRAAFGLIYDFKPVRNPITGATPYEGLSLPGATPHRGFRYEASLQHIQKLSTHWYDRVDAYVLSDGFYLRDFTPDILAREAGYLRSAATVYRRTDDTFLGLDVVVRQDLTWGYPLFYRPEVSPGQAPRGPNPLARLPALTFALPEKPLLGPLTASFRAEWVRLSPIRGLTGDEGMAAREGQFPGPVPVECQQKHLYSPSGVETGPCENGPLPDHTGIGDGQYQPGERESRQRLELRPRLGFTQTLGGVATATAFAAWHQGVWLGELTGRLTHRGYPLLGARIDSELARNFGTGEGSIRHTIAPAVELRWLPLMVGSAPAPYDEIDTAIPLTGRALQLYAEVRQRILRREGRGFRELLRLDLGQSAELPYAGTFARVGESYVRASLLYGPFYLQGLTRFDVPRQLLTRAAGRVGYDDGRRGIYLSYENVIDIGPERSRIPVDLLVASVPLGVATSAAQSISFGGRWSFGPVGLRYDALMLDRDFLNPVLRPDGRAGPNIPAVALAQHSVGVSWAPACDCWRLEVNATQRLDERLALVPTYRFPDFGATLTVSQFGSFGVAR